MNGCVQVYVSLDVNPGDNVLVFPAASNPSMSSRISLDPKSLPITLENWVPILEIGVGRSVVSAQEVN